MARFARATGGRRILGISACIVLVSYFSALTARADLTTVHAPPGAEASHVAILNHVYGGSFGPAVHGAPSYTNGTITATRIEDVLAGGGAGSDVHLVFGGPGLPTTDQRWHDGIAITSAEAKFAAYSQEFGYDDGAGYVKLFDASVTGPSGFDVSGTGSHHFQTGVPWNWVRSGQGGTYYSSNARNGDGLDHMVTYQITGASSSAGETVWLLLWEDLSGPYGGGSDRDFNDLAVEVRATVVPAPAAALLALSGLVCLVTIRRRTAAN